MMKRKNLFVLVAIIATVATMLQSVTLAAWEPYYQEKEMNEYAVRVVKTYNDAGQTVYTAYNSLGAVVLDIRARVGNIWNETTQVLLSSTNKGADFVGISQTLDVFGINNSGNPMKYRKGFQKGEIPYCETDVVANGMQTDANGVLIGMYTLNGALFPIEQGSSNFNNYNNINYTSYPRVVQNSNNIYYYYDSNNYVTYKYNSNSERLEYNNTSLSGITEVAFAYDYLVAVGTSSVYQIEIGSLHKYKTWNYKFYSWIYENNYSNYSDTNWVIGYVDTYGSSHYFDRSSNRNYYYDDDYYDDYYYDNEYPYFSQNGTKYEYYANSRTTYIYTCTASGKLSYNNLSVATNVEQIEFAEGYLVFVDSNNTAYKVRVGSTSKTKICSNFEEFEYDRNGKFVTMVIDMNGRNYYVDD